jgi:hypothetical protein
MGKPKYLNKAWLKKEHRQAKMEDCPTVGLSTGFARSLGDQQCGAEANWQPDLPIITVTDRCRACAWSWSVSRSLSPTS